MSTEDYVSPGLRLGRQQPDERRLARSIKLADVLTGTLPAHPLVDDNLTKVRSWGLYANNRFGTCGPASLANHYRLVTAYLTGAQRNISDADVFDLYRRSGNPNFDPNTGADDNGVEMSTMLSAAVAGGVGGAKPLAFAQVDATSIEEMRAAVAIFGGVLWGSDLQSAQESQFTHHQDWDYVPGSGDWGGHATLTGKYLDSPDDRIDRMTTITWEVPKACTNAFINHSVQEAWVVVWPENVGSSQFQQGIDQTALASDFQALTGQTLDLGPTPSPTPPAPPAPSGPPTPAPSPAPTAGPSQASRDFYAAIATFVGQANTWARAENIQKKGSQP